MVHTLREPYPDSLESPWPERKVSTSKTVCKNPTHRTIAEPQKRGVKGYFTGSRLEFLTGYRDEYISLHRKSRHQFWHKFFGVWWEKYPWRLADHEEPPIGDPKKMEELAYVGEDESKKRAVEEALREVSSFVENFIGLG